MADCLQKLSSSLRSGDLPHELDEAAGARASLPALAAFALLGFAPFALVNTLWSQVAVVRSEVPEGSSIGCVTRL